MFDKLNGNLLGKKKYRNKMNGFNINHLSKETFAWLAEQVFTRPRIRRRGPTLYLWNVRESGDEETEAVALVNCKYVRQ